MRLFASLHPFPTLLLPALALTSLTLTSLSGPCTSSALAAQTDEKTEITVSAAAS